MTSGYFDQHLLRERVSVGNCSVSALQICLFVLFFSAAGSSHADSIALYAAANEKMEFLLTNLPIVKDLADTKERSPGGKYKQAIGFMLDDTVNVHRLGRGIMGDHYKQASDRQRQRFYNKLRDDLIRVVASGLMRVDFKTLVKPKIVPPKDEPSNSNAITIEFERQNGATVPVLISVIPPSTDRKLQVVNVVVMGINFGIILRHQFSAAYYLTGGDIDSVIASWMPLVI